MPQNTSFSYTMFSCFKMHVIARNEAIQKNNVLDCFTAFAMTLFKFSESVFHLRQRLCEFFVGGGV
jgi:hypothetical protein